MNVWGSGCVCWLSGFYWLFLRPKLRGANRLQQSCSSLRLWGRGVFFFKASPQKNLWILHRYQPFWGFGVRTWGWYPSLLSKNCTFFSPWNEMKNSKTLTSSLVVSCCIPKCPHHFCVWVGWEFKTPSFHSSRLFLDAFSAAGNRWGPNAKLGRSQIALGRQDGFRNILDSFFRSKDEDCPKAMPFLFQMWQHFNMELSFQFVTLNHCQKSAKMIGWRECCTHVNVSGSFPCNWSEHVATLTVSARLVLRASQYCLRGASEAAITICWKPRSYWSLHFSSRGSSTGDPWHDTWGLWSWATRCLGRRQNFLVL